MPSKFKLFVAKIGPTENLLHMLPFASVGFRGGFRLSLGFLRNRVIIGVNTPTQYVVSPRIIKAATWRFVGFTLYKDRSNAQQIT